MKRARLRRQQYLIKMMVETFNIFPKEWFRSLYWSARYLPEEKKNSKNLNGRFQLIQEDALGPQIDHLDTIS